MNFFLAIIIVVNVLFVSCKQTVKARSKTSSSKNDVEIGSGSNTYVTNVQAFEYGPLLRQFF